MSFEKTTLGEYATVQGGYAFKSQDFIDEGRNAVLKIKNIRHGFVDYESPSYVSDELASVTSKWATETGDILISMTGSGPSAPESLVGRVARVWKGEPRALINQRVGRLRLRNIGEIDQDFLFYVLAQKETQEFLVTNSTGSANQVNISSKTIESVECPRVGFQVGREIASFLNALEERERLLRATNATLEAIVQALFKSWFVDFDPVRAKMEGREPDGMDEATAALFPNGFEESELGQVPKGWRVLPIGDVVEAVGGATPDTKNLAYWEPPLHFWTTPKDLSGVAAPVLFNTERKLSDEGLARIGSGLLPTGTLLLSSRAPIGYLALTQAPMAINQGYIAIPPGGLLPPIYMLYWCRQNMENIKSRANGSTFMEISKKVFRPIPALVPPPGLVAAFVDVTESLFENLFKCEMQIQILSGLRDTMLPRLISGQLAMPVSSEFQ